MDSPQTDADGAAHNEAVIRQSHWAAQCCCDLGVRRPQYEGSTAEAASRVPDGAGAGDVTESPSAAGKGIIPSARSGSVDAD